jgi:hypothetical protein
MAFGINVKEITAQVNAKFDQLIAKLDEILRAIQTREQDK